ncbi:hypothetical protein COLO4_34298 [Corchorus olitorius]|uniref:Protein kinase domain-containing protein n=1 Tax=Corchorus olitorius TaxID=93759 RepID=A0A1R3GM58_9ROSI|nr:hypothetical protein COLO4_34298 [Corchorus olitorius]
MGICWGSPAKADNLTPSTTGHLSSVTSNTTSNTASSSTSRGSNISRNSGFSASSGDENFPNGQILPTPNLRIFSFAELKVATKNFRPDMVLGEGGFGKVFKGWLDEKTTGKSGSGNLIAVKKLNSESLQGFEEWQVVKTFASSFIVAVRRGSTVQSLDWDIRLKISIGAAKGLSFLHTSEKQVIYRDFKASNILLDGSYTAKISDFGLAKLGPSASQSHVTTRVMGTYGYAAPEYVATGHLYVKSDVYGFGVVLVEILTGLRALDPNRPSGQHTLVDWIKPYLSDRRKLKNIMDHRLEGRYPSKAAFRIAQLALKCLAPEPKHRPSMKEVVQTLEQIESANEKPTEPRNRSSHHRTRRHGQQPVHHRSPLAPMHEAGRAYQNPPPLR